MPFIVICLASLLMVVIMFMTDILLDPGTVATTRSYSLSRTQLALWILIIFCARVYVWSSKEYQWDEFITFEETALILFGISSSVTVLARSIDKAGIQNGGRRAGRHRDRGRVRFFRDILSNEKGISLYRFQSALFTVLLMVAFITVVLQTGKMPEFDKTILLLYGISGAVYLGAKMNEKK